MKTMIEPKQFIVTREQKAFKSPKDKWLHTIGCEILTRAVNDWRLLDFGRKTMFMFSSSGTFVYRYELIDFFFSKWFEALCGALLAYTPDEVKAALGVYKDEFEYL